MGPRAYVEFATDSDLIAALRQYKSALYGELQEAATRWKSGRAAFAENARHEAESFLATLLDEYRNPTGRFDPVDIWALVTALESKIRAARPTQTDARSLLTAFLRSSEPLEAPFLYIMSHIRAMTAEMVQGKTPQRLEASYNYDLMAISTYAPYCDAMVIDKTFYAMAERISVDDRFGVRLFTGRTLNEFGAYLDQLLATIPGNQRSVLREVYPELAQVRWLSTP